MSAVQELPAQGSPRFGGLKLRASRHRSWSILIGMAVVGAILPLLAYTPIFTLAQPTNAWLDGYTNAGVFVLLALGLNLVVGVAGLLDLGYAAFFAIGSYAFAFAASLRKEPIAAKDNSGFIVNLLLVPYLLDAIRAVERGVGSVPDIDKAMQLGCGYPMGPLTLLDFVGLDTTHHIAEIMFKEYREARYAPPPLLKRMVMAGMYGKKSGKGFYDYASNPPTVSNLGV